MYSYTPRRELWQVVAIYLRNLCTFLLHSLKNGREEKKFTQLFRHPFSSRFPAAVSHLLRKLEVPLCENYQRLQLHSSMVHHRCDQLVDDDEASHAIDFALAFA